MPPAANEPCPFCGKPVSATVEVCPHCGEDLFEDDDAPPRPPRRQAEDGTQFIIPTNVSPWAIGACYAGLVGFCLPFIGLIFAIPAVLMAIIALRKAKTGTSYGAVTSNVRAWIGLVLGGLAVVGWGGLLVYVLLQRR